MKQNALNIASRLSTTEKDERICKRVKITNGSGVPDAAKDKRSAGDDVAEEYDVMDVDKLAKDGGKKRRRP
ncbi:hypothetical protein LTR62_004360 [Meristemomyces frigidus]|uniref:Uncharacterized protein n=1 Tax=Meristemomyces frigidus TaxID=1508187 RepID=A0AAN7YK34_9PEZI|nr:hypothetical protein LTR62_004360 [Meristemomyces frigidus]